MKRTLPIRGHRAAASPALLLLFLIAPLRAAMPTEPITPTAPPSAISPAIPSALAWDSTGSTSTASTASTSPAPLDTIWSDTRAVFTDAALLFARPLHFTGRDWGTTVGVLATTGGLMVFDERIKTQYGKGGTDEQRPIVKWANTLGTPYPMLAVAVPLYVGGLLGDAPGLRVAGRHVVQSAMYAGLITTVAKVLIGRHRPFLNEGAFRYEGPTTHDEFNSLPSGHTTAAFALCSTLAAEIDNTWASIGLYSLAALTGAARIYTDRHWASDVFLGAAIGTACGYGVVHLDDANGASHSSLMVYPTLTGITAVVSF